jgi:Methyltransferase FkbM domain
MQYWKYPLYRFLKRVLPRRLGLRLGAISALRPVRDRFFRPMGVPEVVEGLVNWEGWQFHYAAPHQHLYKAQQHGVENGICRIARAVLRDGDIALDVGANYGFITIVMGKSVQPSGRVVSFDIDARICGVLARTLEANDLSAIASVVVRKVGFEDSVDCVTVDTIVAERQLASLRFIKIDVDGGDFDVLRGAYRTLTAYHPVVVVEMTTQQSAIHSFLLACGYSTFRDQSNMELSVNEWPPNLVASVEPIVMTARDTSA